MVMKQRGGTKAKPEGNAERFSIYIFSIRREVNSWNLHLQKLRGLCKYLANVYKCVSSPLLLIRSDLSAAATLVPPAAGRVDLSGRLPRSDLAAAAT
jgi:hypothetical protein